jgi:hypothetical protein
VNETTRAIVWATFSKTATGERASIEFTSATSHEGNLAEVEATAATLSGRKK